jgi:hypothetical protein
MSVKTRLSADIKTYWILTSILSYLDNPVGIDNLVANMTRPTQSYHARKLKQS